tara:strand:- start:178 stop:432 length:255 start_codon:yes stop_codon:yes gene_type:complete
MVENLSFSISKFLELSDSGHFDNMYCSNCSDNAKFTRIFGETSSKITKDKERVMAEIKEDVRKIADEVRAGNENMIRQVYGEDI